MTNTDTQQTAGDGFAAPYSSSGPVDVPLRSLVRRLPLVVSPATTLRETLYLMNQFRGDAVVVTDEPSGLPLGIVTLNDMLHVITFEGGGLDEPVAGFMVGAPTTLPADASAHRAKVLMTNKNLRHLVLVEQDGRLCNLVSQSDLFGLPTSGAEALVDGIAAAKDLDAMVRAADAIRRRGRELFSAGMGVNALCQWMSGLNDLVGIRVIELIEDEFDLPPVPWCWMVFGSEGRLEQTFSTDQDNGIMFLAGDPDETNQLRESFLPFAQAVNGALHTCGFERCRGDIMAGNPDWCLSQAEWQSRFSGWMSTPEPQALLHSTVFFDFRPLYGRYELVDELRSWLMPLPPEHPRFLRALAEQALTCSPALGWAGNFVYDRNKDHPRTVDLKLQGARPFVDAARIWSLAHGIWATNTGDRLRDAGQVLMRKPEDTAAAVEAFQLIQRFRIQQQLLTRDPERTNRLAPASLNELHRLMLKEALKQGKRLQLRLKQDYDL
jgi:CBS domain-containing protein